MIHTSTPLDPATILLEDHHLIVVNKPAPLLTQAPPGVPNLEAMIKEYIRTKYAKPGGVYLGVPHRLDRTVSGVIVFTRNTKASQRMHKQFEDRETVKTYWALVAGKVEPESGVWEDWIIKVPDEPRVVKAEPDQIGAKKAVLAYRVVKTLTDQSLLELKPETGRMHQLRVQSAWRGHPILGDELYGSKRKFGPDGDISRERVIALHARSLTFRHPFRGELLTIEAPLPTYWPEISSMSGT